MANLSPIPDADALRPDESASANQPEAPERTEASPAIPAAGPRKLIRPALPARVLGTRRFSGRNDLTPLAHYEVMSSGYNGHESSHAETFYLQKQAQTQTPMVFILEDGERIEGIIEWYDRNAIKVKNHSRTLIYKSSIKYLFKANEFPQRG